MEFSIISTDRAPRSASPLSQATRFGSLLFVSGQVPVDPATGKPVGGDIEVQTRQVMENLRAVIEAAGGSMDRVLKTTCFLTDIANAPVFNQVYASYFPNNRPARSTFEVSRLAGDILVEIEAIACLPDEG